MTLSNGQISVIRTTITQSKVTIATLADDLLDHLCCVTEGKMESGKSFDVSLQEAITELAPEGLIEIEKEALFLLNFNEIMFMKKLTFLVGLLCAIAMGAGCILALINLPIGHMIFGLAAFVFIILFLPLEAVRYFRVTTDLWTEKLLYVFSTSSSIILAIGVSSRLMLLPGADEMLILGLIIFVGGFLPLQLFKIYKNSFSNG